MKKKTFKDFLLGTLQGLILIVASYAGTIWAYKNMFKDFEKED